MTTDKKHLSELELMPGMMREDELEEITGPIKDGSEQELPGSEGTWKVMKGPFTSDEEIHQLVSEVNKSPALRPTAKDSNMVVKRGRGRPPKHGAYSKYALDTLTDLKIKEIYDIMTGESMAAAPSDRIYVSILGRLLAQMEILDRWFLTNGYLADIERGTPWPCVGHYLNLAKQAAKQLEQLGMSPTARFHLGKQLAQATDIASKIQQARGEAD